MTQDKDRIVALLREHGINPTPQRVEIARIMLSAPQHLSAEQVLSQVNDGERALVSKATVYNTLGLFADKGLVREVIVDPSRVMYDSNTSNHYHFYNVDTGELYDIQPGDMNVSNMPDIPDDTEVDGVEVIVRLRNRN
jgi:Fur family iron response transcriptional regulator